MGLEFQQRFNEHVQKIIDLKGKAIDVQTWEYKGLSPEDEAELKRLEASLPEDTETLELLRELGMDVVDTPGPTNKIKDL